MHIVDVCCIIVKFMYRVFHFEFQVVFVWENEIYEEPKMNIRAIIVEIESAVLFLQEKTSMIVFSLHKKASWKWKMKHPVDKYTQIHK